MAHKHMKTCSTSLATREMQNKTTVSREYIPIGMATIQNNDNTDVDDDAKKLGHSYIAGRNIYVFTLENSLVVSSQAKYKTNI